MPRPFGLTGAQLYAAAPYPTAQPAGTLYYDGASKTLMASNGSVFVPVGPGGIWYASSAATPDPVDVANPHVGDMFLYAGSGDVFRYSGTAWVYDGNIKGPTGVSTDAGNAAKLGADSLIYVPTVGAPAAWVGGRWPDPDLADVSKWDFFVIGGHHNLRGAFVTVDGRSALRVQCDSWTNSSGSAQNQDPGWVLIRSKTAGFTWGSPNRTQQRTRLRWRQDAGTPPAGVSYWWLIIDVSLWDAANTELAGSGGAPFFRMIAQTAPTGQGWQDQANTVVPQGDSWPALWPGIAAMWPSQSNYVPNGATVGALDVYVDLAEAEALESGAAGTLVPPAGHLGETLAKLSETNGDTGWVPAKSGPAGPQGVKGDPGISYSASVSGTVASVAQGAWVKMPLATFGVNDGAWTLVSGSLVVPEDGTYILSMRGQAAANFPYVLSYDINALGSYQNQANFLADLVTNAVAPEITTAGFKVLALKRGDRIDTWYYNRGTVVSNPIVELNVTAVGAKQVASTAVTKYGFAYRRAAALSYTVDGWTTIPCDTQVYDTASAYSTATGIWTAPVTGMVKFSGNASALFTGSAPSGSVTLAISLWRMNPDNSPATDVRRGGQATLAQTAIFIGGAWAMPLEAAVPVVAGEKYALRYYVAASGTTKAADVSVTSCYFEGFYLQDYAVTSLAAMPTVRVPGVAQAVTAGAWANITFGALVAAQSVNATGYFDTANLAAYRLLTVVQPGLYLLDYHGLSGIAQANYFRIVERKALNAAENCDANVHYSDGAAPSTYGAVSLNAIVRLPAGAMLGAQIFIPAGSGNTIADGGGGDPHFLAVTRLSD